MNLPDHPVFSTVLGLVWLRRLFGRINPALPPFKKEATALKWVEAACGGLVHLRWMGMPIDPRHLSWAGTTLCEQGTHISPPHGLSYDDFGDKATYRRFANDHGGVGGQALIKLAELMMDFAQFPLGRLDHHECERIVKEAQLWAACHWDVVSLLLEAAENLYMTKYAYKPDQSEVEGHMRQYRSYAKSAADLLISYVPGVQDEPIGDDADDEARHTILGSTNASVAVE